MGRIEDLKIDELIKPCCDCRILENQQSCLTCTALADCARFKNCVEWFNDYDIKYEMFFLKNVTKNNGDKLKLGRVLDKKEGLTYFSKELIKKINELSKAQKCSNKEDIISLYLFFKLQSDYGCCFDCDHLSKSIFHDNRLVDALFFKYSGCCMEQKKYTIFSIQCIWGKTIESFNIGIKANDYNQQYEKLSTIQDAFGEDLFDAFANIMHYYHTIGNFMPCPNPLSCGVQSYNQKKGLGNFDRMDYFIESGKGRTFFRI